MTIKEMAAEAEVYANLAEDNINDYPQTRAQVQATLAVAYALMALLHIQNGRA